jgi:hypothetical protein
MARDEAAELAKRHVLRPVDHRLPDTEGTAQFRGSEAPVDDEHACGPAAGSGTREPRCWQGSSQERRDPPPDSAQHRVKGTGRPDERLGQPSRHVRCSRLPPRDVSPPSADIGSTA